MQIRPARPEDAGALARIYHDAVQIGSAGVYTQAQRDGWSDECPSAADWAERIDGLITFVAEDGVPIGFLSMEPGGLIDLLFVTPPRIGQGVAFALYGQALAHARTAGLTLLTVEASRMSRRFFTRQGWRVTGRVHHRSGPARVVGTLMDLRLD